MSKAVLISIRPKWCAKILNGEKTIEVRKTRPSLMPPFKCYIYCTKSGRPLVYGDVFCGDWIEKYTQTYGWSREEADRLWGVLSGKVVGEFVCDRIHKFSTVVYLGEEQTITDDDVVKQSCVSRPELREYKTTEPPYGLYGWHISDLKIYDEPEKISSFSRPGKCTADDCCSCRHYIENPKYYGHCSLAVNTPPQSWCYVEEKP